MMQEERARHEQQQEAELQHDQGDRDQQHQHARRPAAANSAANADLQPGGPLLALEQRVDAGFVLLDARPRCRRRRLLGRGSARRVGFSLAAMACAHSSWRPYLLTTVGVAPGGGSVVVPNSPSSHGLQTSTVHSSLAFWSTTPLPAGEAEVGRARPAGRAFCTGTQLLCAGAGSLGERDVQRLGDAVGHRLADPGEVGRAGRSARSPPRTRRPSRWCPRWSGWPRLRIRPCQASQIAPMMTTRARYGK